MHKQCLSKLEVELEVDIETDNVRSTPSLTDSTSLRTLGFRFTPIPADATPHQELAIWMYDDMRIGERLA